MTVSLRSTFDDLDGCRVHSVEGGEGPPVVLIHGFGVSGSYMLPLARVLSRSCRVLVPDLPGSGMSGRPRETLDVPALARLLSQLLEARGFGTAPLAVAHSFGCQITTALAVTWPGAVGSMVLIGPTVDPARRSGRRQLFSALRALTREPESVIRHSVRSTGPHDALTLAATARVVLEDRIEDRLPLIRQRVVVVVGGRDAFVDVKWARRATDLLPNGRLMFVPGEPHALHYTRPELVADVVETLLDEECEQLGSEFVGRFQHWDVAAGEPHEPTLRNQPLPFLR